MSKLCMVRMIEPIETVDADFSSMKAIEGLKCMVAAQVIKDYDSLQLAAVSEGLCPAGKWVQLR